MVSKQDVDKLKKGKEGSSVYQVRYLPRAHIYAILDDNYFRIFSMDWKEQQEISLRNKKEKVQVFCLNMGVYRTGSQ